MLISTWCLLGLLKNLLTVVFREDTLAIHVEDEGSYNVESDSFLLFFWRWGEECGCLEVWSFYHHRENTRSHQWHMMESHLTVQDNVSSHSMKRRAGVLLAGFHLQEGCYISSLWTSITLKTSKVPSCILLTSWPRLSFLSVFSSPVPSAKPFPHTPTSSRLNTNQQVFAMLSFTSPSPFIPQLSLFIVYCWLFFCSLSCLPGPIIGIFPFFILMSSIGISLALDSPPCPPAFLTFVHFSFLESG